MFLPLSPTSIAAPVAGGLCLQPTTLSLRSLPYPSRSARAPQKPRLPRRPSPSRLLQGVLHRDRLGGDYRPDRVHLCLDGSPAPLTVKQSSDRISTGRAGVQQQQLGMHPLLLTMTLGPAGPLGHLPGLQTLRRESHGRGQPRPPPRPLLLPPRRSPRYRSCPTATAQSPWEFLSYGFRHLLATRRLHLPS